jgi:hypothetical protein
MSLNKDDVKHGIDTVAAHLKDAVDKITEKTSESRGKSRSSKLLVAGPIPVSRSRN